MHKVGENETNDEYSYEDNSDSDRDEVTTRTQHNPSYPNGNGNSGRFNPYPNSNRNGNAYNGGYDNMYHSWNASTNMGGMGNQRDFNNQFQYQYQNQNPGYGNSFNSNKTSGKNNQTEQDRACLVLCFFHELKMVNIA